MMEEKIAMYRKRLRMGIGIVILIGGLLTGVVYSEDLKVGAVDIQKAVNQCNAGKEAKQALTEEVEKYQRLIAEKQKELQEMKELLEKQGLMLKPETRAEREKEYQTKLRDFQRWGEDSQNEVNQKRMEMERNIYIGLQKVIQKVGADEGYTLILEKNENIVLFNSKSVDITDQVIKAYDAQKK
jgi:outer membrane protein